MSPLSLTGTLQETLALFEDAGEPWTTPEVAEQLDLGRRAAYARLERLVEQNYLETKKVGANARVWWRPVSEAPVTPSEQAHGEDRAQFERLVEAVEEYAIFTLDTEGDVQTWNPGAEQIKGYEADEIVGEHFSVFYTEDDRDAGVPEQNLSEAATQGWVEDEGWRVRADGSQFWANVTITAIYDDDALEGFAKVTRDMTERHEHEEELRQQRDYTRRILETAPVGVLTVERDGTFTTANRQATELLELGGNDGTATVGVKSVYDEDGEELPPEERPYVRAFETGEPVRNWHAQLELADGSRRWLSTNVEPMTDEDGDVERVLVTIEDVSQLKEQAERLERQRDDLESELESVFERVDDGFVALDEEFRFTYVNAHASDLLGRPSSELLDEYIWDAFERVSTTQVTFEEALETQQPVSVEEYYEPLETWFETHVYPSEDGLSVYFRDITERKERERELEQFRRIIETVSDGIYVLDGDRRFTMVNDAFVSMTGYAREEVVGSRAETAFGDKFVDLANEKQAALESGERDVAVLEEDLHRADGTTLDVESRFTLFDLGDGETGRVGTVRDITGRKQRERELARFKRAVEAAGHSIYMTAPDGTITYVNPTFEEMTGYSREDALGQTPAILDSGRHGDEYFDRLWETITVGERWDEEIVNQRKDGELYTAHQIISPVTDGDGDVDQFVAIQTDVTERKEREEELQIRVRQQEVVTDLGRRALEDRDPDALMADAVELVADTLDNDYCMVLDLDPGAQVLLLRQGVGWHDGIVGEATVSSVENDSQAAYTLASEQPVVVEDLTAETRFGGPDLLTDHDVKSGISVVVGPHDEPWGILGTHDTARRTFAEQDVNFVQSVANVLTAAITRHRDERALRRQREELAALNNLNTIVSDITETVLGKSTREEVEEAVCEALAATESYEFAWLAGVDPKTDTFEPRATAGTEGYAEEISISLDPDDPGGQGPGATAIRERETQVVHDVFAEPAFEPWRDTAREYGFSSVASIPIIHEGTVYGVLGVYADRANAFDTAERTVISRLGEVVGHAIASIERKRALLSEEVVELTFQVRDFFEEVGTHADPRGTILFDEIVPLTDDEFLVYGTATADAREGMERIQEALPRWEAVTFHEEEGDTTFELKLSEHSVLSTLASLGGSLEEAVIEDGDYQLTVHLAPGTNVRRLTETVQESYPGVEMMTRRQITRTAEQGGSDDSVVETLTDRQLAALQAAYHSGFFEWPRDSSGEDVADSLGVAPPTFHYHLRKAEKNVIGRVLSAGQT